MKRKHFFITGIGILCAIGSYSQNDMDVMRYSQITFGGTARFNSMAGSMGALGGDISTLSFNPAGIGVFRKSEFSFSPSLFLQTTSSTYKDMNNVDGRLNFNFGNIGIVVTFPLKNTTSGWNSLNFGFGYNRTNNFYNRITTSAPNKTSSLLDTYVDEAYGKKPKDLDDFSTGLAYDAFLINPLLKNSTQYVHVIPHYGELQTKNLETKGGMGDIDISFGGNYQDRLYIGATLGIVRLNYQEEYRFSETDEKDTIDGFKSFAYRQSLNSSGTGINFKVGVIAKATDWLRLGAAIHSPTKISMADIYSYSFHSVLENISPPVHDAKSPEGNFNYIITTPFRAIGSIGFIINKRGLLNAEYEYVNYKNGYLSSTPMVFSDVNRYIRKQYVSAGNIRIGGEMRFDPISLRLGYALYGSPFANGINKAADRASYTAGIGYRKNSFFLDAAFVLSKYRDYSYLYDPAFNNSSVKNDYTATSLIFTIGFRF